MGLYVPTVADYVVLEADPREVPAVVAALQRALPDERRCAVTAVADEYFFLSATVLTQSEIQRRFGLFGVRASGGDVSLEPAWVAEHVVERHVPVLGSVVVCNAAVLPDLAAAMAQLDREGLSDLVDVADFQRGRLVRPASVPSRPRALPPHLGHRDRRQRHRQPARCCAPSGREARRHHEVAQLHLGWRVGAAGRRALRVVRASRAPGHGADLVTPSLPGDVQRVRRRLPGRPTTVTGVGRSPA